MWFVGETEPDKELLGTYPEGLRLFVALLLWLLAAFGAAWFVWFLVTL